MSTTKKEQPKPPKGKERIQAQRLDGKSSIGRRYAKEVMAPRSGKRKGYETR